MLFRSQVVMGYVFFMNSTTVNSDTVHFMVRYVRNDPASGNNYYSPEITINNVSLVVANPHSDQNSNDIQNVELFFTSATGSNLTVNNIGYSVGGDIRPDFVTFQNGIRTTTNGITLNSPPEGTVNGDGFTVQPDYNGVFYAVCTYPKEGTYLQRHFINDPNGLPDWSNYKDLLVTVANDTTTPNATDTSKNDASTLGGQLGNVFGLSSATAIFVLWILTTFILAVLLAMLVHPIMGALLVPVSVIVGTIIGTVPIWVTVVLVIVTALIITKFAKDQFGDSSSGE